MDNEAFKATIKAYLEQVDADLAAATKVQREATQKLNKITKTREGLLYLLEIEGEVVALSQVPAYQPRINATQAALRIVKEAGRATADEVRDALEAQGVHTATNSAGAILSKWVLRGELKREGRYFMPVD